MGVVPARRFCDILSYYSSDIYLYYPISMLDAWVIEKLKEEADYKPELRIVIDAPEIQPKEPETIQERRIIIIDVLCHSTTMNLPP